MRKMFSTANFWSLVLIVSAVVAGKIFVWEHTVYKPYNEKQWSTGGIAREINLSATLGGAALVTAHQTEFGSQKFIILESSAVLASSNPITNLISARNGLKKYKVKKGDTLSGIAAEFGIALDTIRFANPGIRSALSIGQELIILPVNGITYEIKNGDSLELVASRYNISAESIKIYNPMYQKLFESFGEMIVLPNVKPLRADYAISSRSGLPDLKTYFSLPARGWNWGELHEENAVDIADACGKPIYVAQEGVVIEESSNGLWNQGYGNYVFVEHPNGTKTRYAHNAKNLVKIGDYITQGQEIALIGNTGNTHGPSGCHLHFEVIGAKNPFAVK